MSTPALLVLGLAATGSVEAASALLTGLTISAAAGGPLLGAIVDRSRRPGRWLAVALGGYAAGLGAVLAGTGQAPTPLVVGVAALTGLLNPALSGGWSAQLPHLVPAAAFAKANSLDAATFGAASLAGPALAGVVAAGMGAPAALAVAIGLVALAVPVAWSLPGRPPAPAGQRYGPLAGLTATVANRPLLRSTAASVFSSAGVGMLTVACPLLGERLLGEAGHGGLLLAAFAATALLANAVLARRREPARPDTIVLTSTLLLGTGTLGAAFAPSAALVVVAVMVAGLGDGSQLTALFAVRHREAPERLRARIFTTGASLKITGLAAGTALAGPLAAQSPRTCLLAGAGVQLAAAATYLAIRIRTPSPARAA